MPLPAAAGRAPEAGHSVGVDAVHGIPAHPGNLAGDAGERLAAALFQRNVGSLEGLYGEAVSVRCEALLAEGLYDTIGTDLHNERYADFFDSFGFKA